MEDFISIYKTYNSMEAELVRAELESEGIPCFIKSDNAGGVLPQLASSNGIEIMIRKEDEIQARELLQERQGW